MNTKTQSNNWLRKTYQQKISCLTSACLTGTSADTNDLEYVNHETRLLKMLLDPARYNKMVLPRWNRTYGVTVKTGLAPMNLVEVVSMGKVPRKQSSWGQHGAPFWPHEPCYQWSYVSNYNHRFLWDVISHPYPNFNVGLIDVRNYIR